MAFNIKIPYVVATHVKKFTSVSSFVNKSKAGAIGMISGVLLVNNGTTVVPVAGGMGVTVSGGASRTLTAATSGSINLFNAATSITYTLPAAVVGLTYDFLWTALETGGQAHVIVTSAASIFLNGAVQSFSGEDVTPSATLGPKQYSGNGSSHLRITCNGTTTGGGIGQWLRFTCISTTIWNVTGTIVSPSGTLATPFSV